MIPLRNRSWILPLLLTLLIVRLWLIPLPSSFWVDEEVTAFVVHYGADHPSFRVLGPFGDVEVVVFERP